MDTGKRQSHVTKKDPTRSITYRLSEKLIAELETEASQKGISQNVLVKQILKNTVEKPKSAMMISDEENIPLSTVYRKLQRLYDGKLLAISGSINRDGKKYFLYMSKIKDITIHCNLEETTIECVLNNTKQEDIN